MRKQKEKEYKVDSTKGNSVLDPKTYKGDALVQVWMDSRVLATLSRWLDKEGNVTRFMSEVVKESLKILVKHLIRTDAIDMSEDIDEARFMLSRKYGVNLNPSGRGEKNLQHNQALSNRLGEMKEEIRYREMSRVDDRYMSRSAVTSNNHDKIAELTGQAMKIMKEQDEEKSRQDMVKDLERISELGLKEEGESKEFDVEKERTKREKKDKEYEEKLKGM